MERFFPLIVVIFFMLNGASASEYFIFDFDAAGIDENAVRTAEALLRDYIADSETTTVVSAVEDSFYRCYSEDCAVPYGRAVGADRVVLVSLGELGENIVVRYRVFDTSTRELILSDRMTAESLEDLDPVMKRVAESVISGRPAEKVVTKEAVTEHEAREPTRRKNFYTYGGKIGYMFPFGGSFGNAKRLVCFDAVGLYEMQHFFVEAHSGYRVNIDADEGEFAYDFPVEFSLIYAFRTGDFSPFVVAGLGMHWISYETAEDTIFSVYDSDTSYWIDYEPKLDDGPSITVGGGIVAFQTYDFRLILDARFTAVFADRTHTSATISVGVTHRKKEGGGICCGLW